MAISSYVCKNTLQLFNRVFNTTLKYLLLFFACLLFTAYQMDNSPRIDDDYLGEQVYWLLHQGKVKSDFGVRSDFGYSVKSYEVYQLSN